MATSNKKKNGKGARKSASTSSKKATGRGAADPSRLFAPSDPPRVLVAEGAYVAARIIGRRASHRGDGRVEYQTVWARAEKEKEGSDSDADEGSTAENSRRRRRERGGGLASPPAFSRTGRGAFVTWEPRENLLISCNERVLTAGESCTTETDDSEGGGSSSGEEGRCAPRKAACHNNNSSTKEFRTLPPLFASSSSPGLPLTSSGHLKPLPPPRPVTSASSASESATLLCPSDFTPTPASARRQQSLRAELFAIDMGHRMRLDKEIAAMYGLDALTARALGPPQNVAASAAAVAGGRGRGRGRGRPSTTANIAAASVSDVVSTDEAITAEDNEGSEAPAFPFTSSSASASATAAFPLVTSSGATWARTEPIGASPPSAVCSDYYARCATRVDSVADLKRSLLSSGLGGAAAKATNAAKSNNSAPLSSSAHASGGVSVRPIYGADARLVVPVVSVPGPAAFGRSPLPPSTAAPSGRFGAQSPSALSPPSPLADINALLNGEATPMSAAAGHCSLSSSEGALGLGVGPLCLPLGDAGSFAHFDRTGRPVPASENERLLGLFGASASSAAVLSAPSHAPAGGSSGRSPPVSSPNGGGCLAYPNQTAADLAWGPWRGEASAPAAALSAAAAELRGQRVGAMFEAVGARARRRMTAVAKGAVKTQQVLSLAQGADSYDRVSPSLPSFGYFATRAVLSRQVFGSGLDVRAAMAAASVAAAHSNPSPSIPLPHPLPLPPAWGVWAPSKWDAVRAASYVGPVGRSALAFGSSDGDTCGAALPSLLSEGAGVEIYGIRRGVHFDDTSSEEEEDVEGDYTDNSDGGDEDDFSSSDSSASSAEGSPNNVRNAARRGRRRRASAAAFGRLAGCAVVSDPSAVVAGASDSSSSDEEEEEANNDDSFGDRPSDRKRGRGRSGGDNNDNDSSPRGSGVTFDFAVPFPPRGPPLSSLREKAKAKGEAEAAKEEQGVRVKTEGCEADEEGATLPLTGVRRKRLVPPRAKRGRGQGKGRRCRRPPLWWEGESDFLPERTSAGNTVLFSIVPSVGLAPEGTAADVSGGLSVASLPSDAPSAAGQLVRMTTTNFTPSLDGGASRGRRGRGGDLSSPPFFTANSNRLHAMPLAEFRHLFPQQLIDYLLRSALVLS